MIYQSGYLTIKDYDRDVLVYVLSFSNDEVRYGFLNLLVLFLKTRFKVHLCALSKVDAFIKYLQTIML